jgi:hypothetical protein
VSAPVASMGVPALHVNHPSPEDRCHLAFAGDFTSLPPLPVVLSLNSLLRYQEE